MNIEEPEEKFLPKNIKWFIIALKLLNFKSKNVIEKTFEIFKRKIHRNSIKRIWDVYQETGDVKRKEGQGRKKIFSETEKENINNYLLENPYTAPKKLEKIKNLNPNNVKIDTIKNVYKELNFIAKRANEGKALNEIQINARNVFALKYKNWTEKEWRKVSFSDESDLFPKNTTNQYAFVKKGSGLPPIDIKNYQTYKVKVWGIMFKNRLYLRKYSGMMTADSYISFLDTCLFDFLPHLEGQKKKKRPNFFMQDNAPAHSSKKTIDWLNMKEVAILDWPARSPDLNPIENLWSFFKDKLWEKKDQIKNSDDTWRFILEILQEIDEEQIKNLYSSMPNRIKEVINKKGKRIRF